MLTPFRTSIRHAALALTVILLFGGTCAVSHARAATLYVDADGNDAWSGSLPTPRGDDGPLATLTAVWLSSNSQRVIPGLLPVMYTAASIEL